MHDYQTLIVEHDHMTLLADRMAQAVSGKSELDAVIRARAELSAAVDHHLRREEGFLYEELLAPGDGAFPAAVAAFRQNSSELTADWADYLRGWDADCIAADWESFSEQTIEMMGRLRERIADENRLVYPLALKGCRIRLRAAA